MARGRRGGGRRSSGRKPALDVQWSWTEGVEVPDRIMMPEDLRKISDVILKGVRGRAPVVTGKFKASLVSKVLKRSTTVRSKLKYMRKLNWDMSQQGKPFAFISPKEILISEDIALDALNRFLLKVLVKGSL